MKLRPRWIAISLVLLVVLPILVIAAWVWATLHFAYSQGERTGYVQKISKKGWVCKTCWEGELAMTPVPGSRSANISNSACPMTKQWRRRSSRVSGRQVSAEL